MNNILLSCSTITGTNVKNRIGEDLGEIKDLMIDASTGKIEYVVLGFGGFLGMGNKYFAIPWEALAIDREAEKFVLDVTKDRLEQAPGFDKDNWPEHASPYFTSVNEFYGKHAVL